ncbi:MAG: STAS/SEC14 domain-containing protein [Chitinophagaceae bacterium]|nr:STAS/SEC14 domain-containing protein [Chitinophagaceae bacterium]
MKVIIPGNTQIIEGEWATYWVDIDGILYALSNGLQKGLQRIFSNFEIAKQIAHNKKVCMLVYLNTFPIFNNVTQKMCSNEMADRYNAIALVAKSAMRKKMMNLFLKLKPPAIPMKSFTNDNEARQWLKKFV